MCLISIQNLLNLPRYAAISLPCRVMNIFCGRQIWPQNCGRLVPDLRVDVHGALQTFASITQQHRLTSPLLKSRGTRSTRRAPLNANLWKREKPRFARGAYIQPSASIEGRVKLWNFCDILRGVEPLWGPQPADLGVGALSLTRGAVGDASMTWKLA
jgi:hypothetical protein